MHDAIRTMLDRYACRTGEDFVHALREILQEVALLGLWRSKFFEHAAFYGGTALRILYGLDRYSEDLDFSLLGSNPDFSLGAYGAALEEEIGSFGFSVEFQAREKRQPSAVDSAFLKTNTHRQLIVIGVREDLLRELHPEKQLKIRLEVDRDPAQGFTTESKYLLQPIPFAVRIYSLPDLFAGKLHAILCRKWKSRVKGRDWYDLVWYVGRHPEVNLRHLEFRMRQSGDFSGTGPLTEEDLRRRLHRAVESLDVDLARRDVSPFVRDPRALELWSRTFFNDLAGRIVCR